MAAGILGKLGIAGGKKALKWGKDVLAKKTAAPRAKGEFPKKKRPPPSKGGRRGMGESETPAEGQLFRKEGTSVRGKSRRGEDPNLLASGDSPQRRIADKMERKAMVEGEPVGELQGDVTVGEQSYLNKVRKGSKQNAKNIADAQKAQEKYRKQIKGLKKQLKDISKDTSKTPAKRISDGLKVKKKIESKENLLEQAVNKENTEIKTGPRIRKGGGTIVPKKMSRVGLSPAEESRSGTMSEAKRKKYAKGGKMQQGYDARKDEQLGMTRGKEAGKKMSEAGRRKVAKATTKPKGTYGFSGGKQIGRGVAIGVGAAKRGLGVVRRRKT